MSIMLDIKPYCEHCPNFEAYTKKETVFGFDDRPLDTEFRIRCERKYLCEMLKSYLQDDEQKGE